MTDRPIIFSAPMVRALLDGRKTQTRRLAWMLPRVAIPVGDGPIEPIMPRSPWQAVQPGDRLWVREAWKPVPSSAYRCSDGVQQIINPHDADEAAVYRAAWDRSSGGTSWKPSIHMPRWASRLTLTVTATRVEPLWNITEADAIAEGVIPSAENRNGHPLTPHVATLSDLWLKLHDYATWASNPDVVVLTFSVAERNIDA